MTKLSVLMACYMQEKYVSEAIDSILNCGFDFANNEIILWDDCSTDGTYEILVEYQRRYPNIIRAMRSDHNLGVAECAAAMVNAAKGEYLMIFDHDDILLPFDLAGELKFMDENPDYAASYGRKLMFDEQKGLHGRSLGGPYSDFLMLLHPPLNNNALIIRKSSALKAGNFKDTAQGKQSGAADIFMWIRLRLVGKLRFDNHERLLHRIHPKQVTSRDKQSEIYIQDYKFFLEYMAEMYPDIHRKLLTGKDMTIPNDKRHIALMIVGGLLRNAEMNSDADRYLFYAKQLAPDDVAVDQQIAELAYNIGRFDDAFRKLTEIYVKYESDHDRLIAVNWMLKIYEEKKWPNTELLAGANALSIRYFTLSPEAIKALENIRKY